MIFTAGVATGEKGGALNRALFNYSTAPAYFDDRVIEEMK